jgi:segregation and condensation protein B
MSLKAKLEAVIYAAEEPVTLVQLAELLAYELPVDEEPGDTPAADLPAIGTDTAVTEKIETDQSPQAVLPAIAEEKRAAKVRERQQRAALKTVVDELIAEYAASDRGMEIREIAGGYRMSTKPEYHDVVRAFVKNLKPVMKLSLQALETLAIVAYKQPVTAPEVSEIRGVESAGALSTLLTRKLITTAGRKQVIGRPILYKTTKDFLLRFGLKDVNELPSMEEFEKMAAEITEPDDAPDIPLPEVESSGEKISPAQADQDHARREQPGQDLVGREQAGQEQENHLHESASSSS